jgi:hypothetical protein
MRYEHEVSDCREFVDAAANDRSKNIIFTEVKDAQLSRPHTIAFAALAILGHKSAHSFPMGPVIAEPAQDTENMTSLGQQ